MDTEARLVDSNAVLLVLSEVEGIDRDLMCNFCGMVIIDPSNLPSLDRKTVYLCGDISKANDLPLETATRVFVIKEYSHGMCAKSSINWSSVDLGRVPLLVHGVGVFYRRFFDPSQDFFNRIRSEHAFQALTESNKPGTAHRTGIYLTPVEKRGDDELHFRLLRCSSNLAGPTGNFQSNDTHIVNSLNDEASWIFQDQFPLNHVLAQIYQNTPASDGNKQTKAKIKEHADKTKDMPRSGIMAFCTFYEKLHRLTPIAGDTFDYGHKGRSGLTTLHFRLKHAVAQRPHCNMTKEFKVTLYPNSVFFMPLSTNRYYTHEIRPSGLDAKLIPTRLGYVVRCSDAEAVFKDGCTFLKTLTPDGAPDITPLAPITPEGMNRLKQQYAEENLTDNLMDYGEVLFSMNAGDYLKPQCNKNEEIRWFNVQPSPGEKKSLYGELKASAILDDLGRGRQGTILCKPDEARGVPLVRTTAKFLSPAQCFQPVHTRLAEKIQNIASIPAEFSLNNALCEHYTHEYATMSFHSDHSLDLAEGSCIALFSCYKHPVVGAVPPRKLVVESKEPGGGSMEIPLENNSVVLISTSCNRRFRHKIVLNNGSLHTQKDSSPDHSVCADADADGESEGGIEHSACSVTEQSDNPWLGMTFRCSKTFLRYDESTGTGSDGECVVRFEDDSVLSLADKPVAQEFYAMRDRENKETDFFYPGGITHTLSRGDLIPPRK
eukprot:CAMPEP_0170450066 /NCGR_PEP_ID=MMETSP0117_2-20130122/51576_1 /TAXON_ID=400756 /ORGANISM="Durinskia baltica, Strain CSIRO CS-38" /LENGTH=714 /DNA_ID=CAMNT_0010711343 /DNA_START=60 /DNA_END=2204 /DNA_ORIENTATION=+